MENGTPRLFREEQSPSTGTPIGDVNLPLAPCLFLGFPVAIICLGIGYLLSERNAEGILCAIGGLLLLPGGIIATKAAHERWYAKLTVEVLSTGVTIQCRVKRLETLSIPYSEIESCAYGELPLGYANGATIGAQGRAFSINSGDGVWIKLKNGEQVFVGSMRPLELMDTIDKIKMK